MIQNNEQNALVQKAREVLTQSDGTPTQKYRDYLKYQTEWENKKSDHQKAYARAITNPMDFHLWAVTGKSYIDAINAAMDKWIAFGNKKEIEEAINILKNATNSL